VDSLVASWVLRLWQEIAELNHQPRTIEDGKPPSTLSTILGCSRLATNVVARVDRLGLVADGLRIADTLETVVVRLIQTMPTDIPRTGATFK
jgi:hypothetical protein